MCRIVGFWDLHYKKNYNIKKVIETMRDTMIHGGPDDAGIYIDTANGLALGHRRLSILDLSSTGRQPMEFENLVITYNGEVYNFKEIRRELETYGYKFISNSDTEVILKAFHKWGLRAVHKFRGMFAFAIWNKEEEKLILCRDRAGVKPLYWCYKDGLFMFSSELKAFHKHPKFEKKINYSAFSLFLQYGYIPAPYSIFENTYKLEPGCFLIVDKNGILKKEKYWDIEEYFLEGAKEKGKWLKKSEEELMEELENLLTESFKLRLVSDVPVGMFLSGGIDSTIVSTLLAKEGIKLQTFTIGFYEKDYNEAHHARRIADYLGIEHTELYCTPKEAFDIIPKLPEIYDEPLADPSAIPTYLVSKLARTKVKVSLSADGADEQFCGYPRYLSIVDKIIKLNKIPFKKEISFLLNILNPEIIDKIYAYLKFIPFKYKNLKDRYMKLRKILQEKDFLTQYEISLKIFLEDDFENISMQTTPFELKDSSIKSLNVYSLVMLRDLKTYLPDNILVKVDRATMSVSLEGREPFLDHKILEWSSQLPYELKCKNGKTKYLLKKFLNKYIPANLIERPKKGFEIPIYKWLRKDLKKMVLEYINSNSLKDIYTLNPSKIQKLLRNYKENKNVNYAKLWVLFIFIIWKEKWL